MFRHISELRRSGSLKLNSNKKHNEPTETQLIFSSITHIHSNGIPTVSLSKREQQTVEDIYNRIKLKHNIFPVSKLRQLFTECGLGTMQWITVAASVVETGLGWTGIISDISRQMESCLTKLASIRDEQGHHHNVTNDKQIAAVLENASHFGVPVLRYVQQLLHSPDVDEDQPDGDRPAPVDEEGVQRALVLLVCESIGSTFCATAELLEEQRQEKLRKERQILQEQEEARRRKEALTSTMKSALAGSRGGTHKAGSTTIRKKVAIPISAAASFRPTTSTSTAKQTSSPVTANEPTTLQDHDGRSPPSAQTTIVSSSSLNNSTQQEESEHMGSGGGGGGESRQQSEERANQHNHSDEIDPERNIVGGASGNSEIQRKKDDAITAATLLENPDNTRVPFEDVLLALSRLKHVATACECIITTIPVILLDQIYKLAKNTDAAPPTSQQCATLISNQVANIYSRALFYFEQNKKQDPSSQNANASYIEFSEQLGLLSAIVDLGTDPRGVPIMFSAHNQFHDNNNNDNDMTMLANDSFLSQQQQESSAGYFGSEASSPGFFRVGSAVIQPNKNFRESQFFSGGFHQPHMANQTKEQLDQLKTVMSSDGSNYASFANAHGYNTNNNNLKRTNSSGSDFTANGLTQEFSLIAGFGDRTATTIGGGDGISPGRMSMMAPRQTFESPLRKETITSIAQNFGLQPANNNMKSTSLAITAGGGESSTGNNNNTTTSSSTNVNDLITLDSIAKEFFSHSQITAQKEMNFASMIALMNHLPPPSYTGGDTQNQQQAGSGGAGAGVDEAIRKASLRRKSMDVVTMLKVTKNFEDAATDAAKQRQHQQQQQGIIASPTSNTNTNNKRRQSFGGGSSATTMLHGDDFGDTVGDNDDDDDDDENDRYREDSEERNRTTAAELLERTNLICSPVMLHPGRLVRSRRRALDGTNAAGGNNSLTNTATSIDRYSFMREASEEFHHSHTSTSNTTTTTRRKSSTAGHLNANINNSRRGSSIATATAATSSVMAEPQDWYPGQQQQQQQQQNVSFGSTNNSIGRYSKPPETSLSKSSKIVKQISNAPNLSSGAKLYYLRQRMAKLQRGEDNNQGSSTNEGNINQQQRKKKNKTIV